MLPGQAVVFDIRRAGMTDKLEAARETVLIDIALQGGGSHGTFTWGVLDPRIIVIMLGFPIDPF
jgi:hypothetical protein